MGIWITPETCRLRSSVMAPMLGARAFICPSSRISQPTEAHLIVPVGSNDARYTQLGIGWALSSHSIMTNGQEQPVPTLSLREALDTGRIDEFAKSAERRLRELGFEDPSAADVEAEIERVIGRQSADRTSRSASGDGSTGK